MSNRVSPSFASDVVYEALFRHVAKELNFLLDERNTRRSATKTKQEAFVQELLNEQQDPAQDEQTQILYKMVEVNAICIH